jgi:histidinol-phosphatase (PHP family)
MVDYHMHTQLCGHASGTVEEYIEHALAIGMQEIGFSDHAPMPESLREGLSMSEGEAEGYIRTIEEYKAKFAGRLIIRLGFEADYPPFESFDKKYFADARIDYIIGSCHYVDGWGFDHPDNIEGYKNRDIDELYKRYYGQIESLAGSGLFNIIGHFDVVKKFGYRSGKDFSPAIERIAKIASINNLAVEMNTNGFNHPVKEMYPSDQIIGILFNSNVPVTLGSDAHLSDRVGFRFADAVEKLRKAGYRKISGFEKRKRYDIPL